jgi:hypothetical protein
MANMSAELVEILKIMLISTRRAKAQANTTSMRAYFTQIELYLDKQLRSSVDILVDSPPKNHR